MHRTALLPMAVLILIVTVAPAWGSPPNPTGSDEAFNTAGGAGALLNVDSSLACCNTAFGADTLRANTLGADNTAVGAFALSSSTEGDFNTAIGSMALESNTEGHRNTAVGTEALRHNIIGVGNTAVGYSALLHNTTASGNTAIGRSALELNQTGVGNTASGLGVLQASDGDYNTATGFGAMGDHPGLGLTTGSRNTATGAFALRANRSGNHNTASGYSALAANTAGNRNTAIGEGALMLSTGGRNTAVGHEAGSALTSGNNNVYLAHSGTTVESMTMRLGQVQTRTFIAGVAGSAISGTPVVIASNGRLGTQVSSARYKEGIEPLAGRSEAVHRLRPVTFVYRDDEQRVRQYGLVAEEVAAVYPELVTSTATGEVQGVRYHELIPLLLNEVQNQHQVLEQQREALQQQLRLLLSQQRELAELRARLEQRPVANVSEPVSVAETVSVAVSQRPQ